MAFVPKIILAVFIVIGDDLYGRLAVFLTDWENYRTDQDYEDHLITKIVGFQFVNSFLSLFYIGFYLQDYHRLSEVIISFYLYGSFTDAIWLSDSRCASYYTAINWQLEGSGATFVYGVF